MKSVFNTNIRVHKFGFKNLITEVQARINSLLIQWRLSHMHQTNPLLYGHYVTYHFKIR